MKDRPANCAAVDERMPVWVALSELYLDTELDSRDFDRMAGALAASRYSEAEIEDILRYEVAPVCRANLLSMAGEWAGFDEQWLREKLTPRIGQRPKWRFSLFGPINPFSTDWQIVREKVRRLRAQPVA